MLTRLRSTRTNPRRRRSAALRFIIDDIDRKAYRAETLVELRQLLGALVATDGLWDSLELLDMAMLSLGPDPRAEIGPEVIEFTAPAQDSNLEAGR